MSIERLPQHLRGFTLLEVLVVVLVIGIMSGIVMLNINPGGAEHHLQEESDRLAMLMEQVASEAVMQNQEYGLHLTENGYEFLCLDEVKQRWKVCTDNSLSRERKMPEGLEIHLLRQYKLKALPVNMADGLDRVRDKDNKDNSESVSITPDIFLLSSGEASAASLEIQVKEKPELRSEIRIDEIGRVSSDNDGRDNVSSQGGSNVR